MDAFEDCLKKGRLKESEPDIEKAARELDTAKEELERARFAFVRGRWEECVTQAYFATHRCARAAINSRGYRDTNLYGLLIGLDKLFVETAQLPKGISKRISEAKDIKDSVYKGRRATPGEGRQLLMLAQAFAKAVFKLLALPGFDAAEIDTTLPGRPDPTRSHLGIINEHAQRAPHHGRSYGNGQAQLGASSPWMRRSPRDPREGGYGRHAAR